MKCDCLLMKTDAKDMSFYTQNVHAMQVIDAAINFQYAWNIRKVNLLKIKVHKRGCNHYHISDLKF